MGPLAHGYDNGQRARAVSVLHADLNLTEGRILRVVHGGVFFSSGAQTAELRPMGGLEVGLQ